MTKYLSIAVALIALVSALIAAPEPVSDSASASASHAAVQLPPFACEADDGALSWTDHSESKYWVYRSVDGVTYSWLGRTAGSPASTTFTDSNPPADSTYQVHYAGIPRVTCTDANDNPGGSAPTVAVVCEDDSGDAGRINSAIGTSPDGAEILITGVCSIGETIRLLGNRSYRGESRSGTILHQAAGSSLDAILASDSYLDNASFTGLPVAVRHLKLRGSGGGDTAGLIVRSWLTTIEDVWVENMGGDGIRLTNRGNGGAALNNTQVNGRISGVFVTGSGNHGIHVHDDQNQVTDWTLTDSWIAESENDGIHIDNAAGWMVERNHVYNVGHHAIWADRLFGSTISNNYVEGFGESGDAAPGNGWYGIFGSVQGSDVASTVHANRVFNFGGEPDNAATYNYIGLDLNYGEGSVSVTGNAVVGVDSSGSIGLKYRANSGTSLDVASTGNSVRKIATPIDVGPAVTVTNGY